MTRARQRLGASGEARALAWYRRHGYELVAQNWRCRTGEVDVVVRRGTSLVVAEVKTRRSLAFGHPAEAVTPVKQARIRQVAVELCRELGLRPRRIRFDVVAIVGEHIDVLEDAF